MITEIAQEVKDSIVSYIETLLFQQKIVDEGDTVRMTIEIGPNRSVQVEIESEKRDVALLQRVLSRMESNQVRTKGAFENRNVTMNQVRKADFAECALKFRNLGRGSITEFARALQKEGVECQWIEGFMMRNRHSERGVIALEIERGFVRKITSTEWALMIEEFHRQPSQEYTETAEFIVGKLQEVDNALLAAAQAFPEDVPVNWRGRIIVLINALWKRRRLPFRVRYVSESMARNKFDGRLQVVVV